jgi:hypothetical protein
MAHFLYETKFKDYLTYFAPEWHEDHEEDAVALSAEEYSGLSHDLKAQTTAELISYVSNHVQFYREALSESGHSEAYVVVIVDVDDSFVV